MYVGPFMFLAEGQEVVWYEHAADAAQRWADEMDARVFDNNNVEIPPEILECLLG